MKVLALYLVDGIVGLGAHQTLLNGKVKNLGGGHSASAIERVEGGYLVHWNGTGGQPGWYFVPMHMVSCAKVDRTPTGTNPEEEYEPQEPPLPAAKPAEPLPVIKPTQQLIPGEIAVDAHGVFYRVPFPAEEEETEEVEEEVAPAPMPKVAKPPLTGRSAKSKKVVRPTEAEIDETPEPDAPTHTMIRRPRASPIKVPERQ